MTDLDLDMDEAEIAIESLRKGIPPTGQLQHFTVGRREQLKKLASTIRDREDHEPAALLVQANYGAGKTHLLRLIREIALEEGFAVSLVTVDSRSAVRFNRMDQIFGAVAREIEVPGDPGKGIGCLFDRYFETDEDDLPARMRARRRKLSMDSQWSRPSEIKSTPLWIALRGWHLSRSEDARDVAESWLSSNWEYRSDRQYLYWHLVERLPPRIGNFFSANEMFRSGAFSFHLSGHENAWLALEDLQTLAVLSGLRGLVLLFDEFEDVIQNLKRIDYQRSAFANLISLMGDDRFTGWKYFAVTPEFVARCRSRLLEKDQFDFPVSMLDDLERIKMTPVGEQEFLELGKKVRALHGIAYDWDSKVNFSDSKLSRLVATLYSKSSADQVRQAMVGLVKALDSVLED
jgi:hypothetical protein